MCGGSWRSQSLLLRQELEWTRETEEEGKGFCTKREKDGRLDAHSSKFSLYRIYSLLVSSLGKDPATKWDEFLEKSQFMLQILGTLNRDF